MRSTFDSGSLLRQLHVHHALEFRQDGNITAMLGLQDSLHDLVSTVFIQCSIGRAPAKQHLG